jgi:hypothetical protein
MDEPKVQGDAEFLILMTMDHDERLYSVRHRIVGSGFARVTTPCLSCGRTIEKGWEAWVTHYIDNSALALHPDCWPGNVAVGVAYTKWLDKVTEMGQ